MKILSKYIIYSLIICLSVIAYIQNGCGNGSGVTDPPQKYDYIINGALVKDLNVGVLSDTARIAIRLQRNEASLSTAAITFDTTDLVVGVLPDSTTPAYVFPQGDRGLFIAGTYDLRIEDSNKFLDTLFVNVTDTFRIESYNPDSTTANTNGRQVNIQWTSAANIEGYVVAVTPADSIHTGYGWSAYVESQASQTTIPPDAFREPLYLQELIPGMYYIYVYGYTGVPNLELASKMLPVPFPTQLPDNIDHTRLAGHFGSIVVSKRVPLEVTGS